ncbi:hypothetical protein CEN49_03715, partial [Fischerella thermalis CCMEE 5273]
DNIPFIGNVKSIYETIWGQDIYGEELSTGDRLLSGAGSLTPWFKTSSTLSTWTVLTM